MEEMGVVCLKAEAGVRWGREDRGMGDMSKGRPPGGGGAGLAREGESALVALDFLDLPDGV